MRAHDWSQSLLGDPALWPQPLKTATAMMLNTLQPMFIAWGPELAFIYNDAYTPMLGARHPRALGARFQDVWADIWDDLAPLADQALAGQAVWQEDLPLLMHRYGYPEQTYFTFTYSPLQHEGKVEGLFCTCIETTGRVLADRSLRETAEALAASEERYRRQGERLFSLFEKAPGFVAVLDGPNHVFTLTNAAYGQLIGHRDIVGLEVREALPELGDAEFFAILDRVYSTGEPYLGEGVTVRLQRTPGAPLEDRYVDFIFQPIRDEVGRVTGIFVQGSDVTERERFLAKQQLLLNELNHRVKNNLATVQAMAAQTARRSPDLPSFIADFEGRLIALARTHDVLTQNAWTGADLRVLLARELVAFRDRVSLTGPAVNLNAGQTLAMGMIAHELATNAAKYGALSSAGGQISVSWRVEHGERLVFDWVESGGPPVRPPGRSGFGTRMIERLTAGDLQGVLETAYPPEGFRLRLAMRTGRPPI